MAVGMPTESRQHICGDCGRAYKAAETLNRHRNNHSDRQYACNVCDAVFKRKDLLDRHLLIHSTAEPSSHRRRGHRACIRCSRLKTRCDNFDPCSRCANAGHICLYKTERGRLRKDSATATPPGSTTGSSTDDIPELDGYADPLLETAASLASSAEHSVNSVDVTQSWSETQFAEWTEWANYSQLDGSQLQQATQSHASNEFPGLSLRLNTGVAPEGVSPKLLSPDSVWVQPDPFTSNPIDLANGGMGGVFEPLAPHLNAGHNPLAAEESCMGLEQILSHQQEAMKNVMALPPSQHDVISELVMLATDFRPCNHEPIDSSAAWRDVSERVQLAFGIHSLPSDGSHLLAHFVKLFLDNFDNHWPILWRHTSQETRPRHLYIVMAAIGAAYAGRQGGELHVQAMHALRRQLLPAAFGQPLDEDLTFTLCQSLAALQAAMLFFGDRAAFQNAQEVGSSIITLAQRVGLFDERCERTVDYYLECSPPAPQIDAKRAWIEAEGRRRLAVGILRLECFLSSLLGTRPKITYEDVNIRTPAPPAVWHSDDCRIHAAYQAAHDRDSHPRLSRVVQTSLETEAGLSSLRPDELEHVLYGLQHRVWRLSQDRALSEQPTNCGGEDARQATVSGELSRLVGALQQWKQAMTAVVRQTDDPAERRTILNSQLLYSVTIMTLEADLPAFHRWALGATRDELVQGESVMAAKRWAASRSGQITAQHALSIRTMVAEELRRPEPIRAIFTIITQISLLHAALVVWVYVGMTAGESVSSMSSSGQEMGRWSGPSDVQSPLGDNATLMGEFADLLRAATPLDLEASTRLRSYHTTPALLAERPRFGSQGAFAWAYS